MKRKTLEKEEEDLKVVCKKNLELMHQGSFSVCKGGPRLRVHPTTGVHEFQVDAAACDELLQVVCDQKNRTSSGHLILAGRVYPGYEDYKLHEAKRHSAIKQKQFISMFVGKPLQHAIDNHPPFKTLVMQACGLLGCTHEYIKQAHIIIQHTPLAVFAWHNDSFDLNLHRKAVSVIIPINDAASGIELWGFEEHHYKGTGCAIAFPAGAHHRSVPLMQLDAHTENIRAIPVDVLQNAPVKLAMFFSK